MDKKQAVGFQIRKMYNQINRYFESFNLHENCNHKTTKVQDWIVDYIYNNQNEDVFQKDLETELSIRKSTVTEILQLMEKNGVIKREKVQYDARLKKIVLTEYGIKRHLLVSDKLDEIEKSIVEGISQEKLDIFFEVIESIRKNMEKGENEND